jgi:poly(3-hydroxybutyrate) depolymerase
MKLARCVPSFVAALTLATGACAPDGVEDNHGAAGTPNAGGNSTGLAGGGGNGGPGGSGSGGMGSGGSAGVGGVSGTAGTSSVGGASGATGTGGSGQAGRGGAGAGGASSGRGGGAGVGGLASGGGASGSGSASSSGGATGGAGIGGLGGRGGATGAGGAAGSAGSASTLQSPGCGKAPTLTSGTRTIQSGGDSRSYILRIPDNYDNSRPYRLIFGYHWNGGTMQDVDGGGTSGATWSYYGLRAQADDSAIFVAPQGIGNGWSNSGGRDLAFTDGMLELITGDLCVDTKQIFALGFSYGGGMSYALACARPTIFRAVAIYSGGVLSGCEGGTQPVAYIGIHGISDGTLNISGGRSMRDRFVMNNGCTAQNPPEPSGGSLTHTCTTYAGCTAGYPVEWCAFDGGHTPGMVDGGGDDGAKTWTKTEVWKFFKQFE